MATKPTKAGPAAPRNWGEAGPERHAEAPRMDAAGRRNSRAWVQDRLRACFDARPEPCLATGRAQRGRVREDFHRADVGRGLRSPALREALDYARSGDTLIVWKLDRLAQSMKQLIETIETLRLRNIGFRSLTEAIDTTTAQGVLVFHMFSALAEFERGSSGSALAPDSQQRSARAEQEADRRS